MLSASVTEYDVADVRPVRGRHSMNLRQGPCRDR